MSQFDAEKIIEFIATSEKKTPVKVYIKGQLEQINFGSDIQTFISGQSGTIFGNWQDIQAILQNNKDHIDDYVIENDRRNSAVPLLDLKDVEARVEPGAFIREHVSLGKQVVVMMGAVINIGAVIGEGTMIDMNAIIGGRGTIGKNCHIGAGAVIAGVIEPPSASPVIIEDDVVVGANAVILEGIRIGAGSVVAAGAVVVNDVPADVVVAGTPAKVIKKIDDKTRSKTEIVQELRNL